MHRFLHTVALALLCVSLAACSRTELAESGGPRPTPRRPPASTAPEPSPSPSSEPAPEPAPPPTAIAVALDDVVVREAGSRLVGPGKAPGLRRAQARRAADAARDSLRVFLEAQLLRPRSRLSGGPVRALLGPRARAALRPADARGLGDVGWEVSSVRKPEARAHAQVLARGREVVAVGLTFHARAQVQRGDGGRGRLVQAGSLLFSPARSRWRVTAADVTLHLRQAAR